MRKNGDSWSWADVANKAGRHYHVYQTKETKVTKTLSIPVSVYIEIERGFTGKGVSFAKYVNDILVKHHVK